MSVTIFKKLIPDRALKSVKSAKSENTVNPVQAGYLEKPENLNETIVLDKKSNVVNEVVEIEIYKIVPNPSQPRVIFDDYELSQLAASIQQNGILQPLTVRLCNGESEQYELISGERRLRASKLAGILKVPCVVIETTSEKSAVLAIVENLQRSDLSYIEEAFAIEKLINHLGITQEEAATRLGVAQSTIANKLRLLRLSDEEKSLVLRYKFNERQARALLRLPSEMRLGAIEKINVLKLNSADTDKLVGDMLLPENEKSEPPKKRSNVKMPLIKRARIYVNTFDHTIDTMRKAGIPCTVAQKKTDEFVEYTVKISLVDV